VIKQLLNIRRQVNDQLRAFPFIQDALRGTLEQSVYLQYLDRVANQYAPHSPKVMALAASRCINTHPELGEYLLKHASDERGHNEWSNSDLLQLGVKRTASGYNAVPACSAMIGYTYYLAGYGNPIALYGWMYILEAVGADLGEDAAKGLKKRFSKSLRFVAGHATADKKHTQELQRAIGRHVRDSGDKADVLHAAEVSANLYVDMFEQVQNGA
jgi:pyrroloquinoline quinone (PQQ) biosynthesis protein C